MCLDSIQSITNDVANALASHRGVDEYAGSLEIFGLETLSEAAAMNLAAHKDDISLYMD